MLLKDLLKELEDTVEKFPLYVPNNVLNIEVHDDFQGNSKLTGSEDIVKIVCNVEGTERTITFDFKNSLITDSFTSKYYTGGNVYNWNGELQSILN